MVSDERALIGEEVRLEFLAQLLAVVAGGRAGAPLHERCQEEDNLPFDFLVLPPQQTNECEAPTTLVEHLREQQR